ncbi:acylphosphatase [Pontibacter sp. G13]|uniref:acylphosphatase n=1 Tax=Pontibacter sp. G13 TaxID=3074898 RepID=UPI002889DDF4|nr:acylphosphatase [Pontibacter sp. G13]WNJ17977.1 acylphosphatase [Pontibacter sp. G13]
MQKRFALHIRGKVQGVWYRKSTQDQAQALGLVGFVRNEPDGSAYAEIEGSPELLEQMVDWCRKGPDLARVDAVESSEMACVGEQAFRIER